jgi:hypothetical protein
LAATVAVVVALIVVVLREALIAVLHVYDAVCFGCKELHQLVPTDTHMIGDCDIGSRAYNAGRTNRDRV